MNRSIAIVLLLSACGASAKQNELIGQVKKVVERTPIVCGDYAEADISLGVIRNGVGSMSKEDVELYVPQQAQADLLKQAATSGHLVKITYDIERVTFCVPDHWVTNVELLTDNAVAAEKSDRADAAWNEAGNVPLFVIKNYRTTVKRTVSR